MAKLEISEMTSISDEKINRLLELSKDRDKDEAELVHYPDGRVYRNDKLIVEDPNEEQEKWFEKRMHGQNKSWETWDQK